MQDQRELERARIDGRAAFAGAAYLIGVGLIFLLTRVGAPDGLVRALGPLFALAGLALLGLLIRSTGVPAFFAAERAMPAPYGGLALAAIAAGLALGLESPGDSPLPLASVALGLTLAALVVAPLLRAKGASAVSDLVATHFPSPAVRLVFAGVTFFVGVLIAAAGFETATNLLIGLFALSRGAAAAIIAVIVAVMIVPGGLAGLVWGAAASAGIVLIIVYLPVAVQLFTGGMEIPQALRDSNLVNDALLRAFRAVDPETRWLTVVAGAFAVAALPPLGAPALASAGPGQAFKAGAFGLLFAALIGMAALVDPLLRPSPLAPLASGLQASAMLLSAFVLAAAGAHAASRAWGLTNARAAQRFPPLSSQRLARSRVLALAVLALCALLTTRAPIASGPAIVGAAAIALALTAPVAALALFSRATSPHAIASLLVSLGTILGLGALEKQAPDAGKLLIGALSAAAAGFAVGWCGAIFSRAPREAARPLSDLFIDAPLDPGA